ncbi:glycosyltransferase [Auraticoccus sp. F435]|uniref:Glycosyltransferase n=1 Tax=Auraticoccus cholistanensis TaxID=2656650 RepID=A0A6A9V123_9ACTN|nr:glycosyltransferase [Auraticoccus cholistanensis]
MRVAIVTESFLPSVNGVAHSVMRVLEHLRDTGHQALVIAPSSGGQAPSSYAGFPVVAAPSGTFPGYPDLPFGVTTSLRLETVLADFQPDVVHAAAPISMGHKAVTVAHRMGIPSVAVYQTEYASFATRYWIGPAQSFIWRRVRNTHSLATMTLAPSSYTRQVLINRGIPRVGMWGRGVDAVRFSPGRRDEELRRRLAPGGERIVGYVGRLAPEKQVEDLRVLADLPGTRLVVIGDGPRRPELEAELPGAVFLGQLTGDDLPRAMASLDVFVHPGEMETFCQSVQEALASGVPAIAPARGGPIDLIDPSHTGWLYPAGDLATLRSQVQDLVGDERKRLAFSRAARESVRGRTWSAVCERLVGHYRAAVEAHRLQQVV